VEHVQRYGPEHKFHELKLVKEILELPTVIFEGCSQRPVGGERLYANGVTQHSPGSRSAPWDGTPTRDELYANGVTQNPVGVRGLKGDRDPGCAFGDPGL
jgi:hypothetical protein